MDNDLSDSGRARMPQVGILAIQGSFAEHAAVCERLGHKPIMVRSVAELARVTHLILPGGESTTQQQLLEKFGLWEAILKQVQHEHLAIFGTCAGAILLSRLGMSIKVDRNAYGAQQASQIVGLRSEKWPDLKGVFIRAPRFVGVGESVQVLAQLEAEPVLVQQGRLLAGSFHPELTEDTRIHEYFLSI